MVPRPQLLQAQHKVSLLLLETLYRCHILRAYFVHHSLSARTFLLRPFRHIASEKDIEGFGFLLPWYPCGAQSPFIPVIATELITSMGATTGCTWVCSSPSA